jgi:hypothetical protein
VAAWLFDKTSARRRGSPQSRVPTVETSRALRPLLAADRCLIFVVALRRLVLDPRSGAKVLYILTLSLPDFRHTPGVSNASTGPLRCVAVEEFGDVPDAAICEMTFQRLEPFSSLAPGNALQRPELTDLFPDHLSG